MGLNWQVYLYKNFFSIYFSFLFFSFFFFFFRIITPPTFPLQCFLLLFFVFVFLGPHPWHMEVPRLGGLIGAVAAGHSHNHSSAGSEPHLWPTPQFTATPDPQSLSKARDWTRNFMVPSRIRFRCTTIIPQYIFQKYTFRSLSARLVLLRITYPYIGVGEWYLTIKLIVC